MGIQVKMDKRFIIKFDQMLLPVDILELLFAVGDELCVLSSPSQRERERSVT